MNHPPLPVGRFEDNPAYNVECRTCHAPARHYCWRLSVAQYPVGPKWRPHEVLSLTCLRPHKGRRLGIGPDYTPQPNNRKQERT